MTDGKRTLQQAKGGQFLKYAFIVDRFEAEMNGVLGIPTRIR